MTRAALALVAGALLLTFTPSPAQAAAPPRCNTMHGRDLAHNAVVKVFKVRSGDGFRYYGCARPRGPVVALTQPFSDNRVKLVTSAGAYVAFTRTIRGSGTIAVVDARTGRKRLGLYPPGGIEFDIDTATPQIGAARVNVRGELVVAYVGLGEGGTTDATIHLYAFDSRGRQQLLDRGPSSKLPMRSIRLKGEDVSWTHDGVTRTAKIGSVPLVVTSADGVASGTVTTAPDVGVVCRITPEGTTGICIGSFDPGLSTLVIATAAAGTPVTISGACTATHVPVLGEAASVAQCAVSMVGPQAVRVSFG